MFMSCFFVVLCLPVYLCSCHVLCSFCVVSACISMFMFMYLYDVFVVVCLLVVLYPFHVLCGVLWCSLYLFTSAHVVWWVCGVMFTRISCSCLVCYFLVFCLHVYLVFVLMGFCGVVSTCLSTWRLCYTWVRSASSGYTMGGGGWQKGWSRSIIKFTGKC